jgi:hypothetical protein
MDSIPIVDNMTPKNIFEQCFGMMIVTEQPNNYIMDDDNLTYPGQFHYPLVI